MTTLAVANARTSNRSSVAYQNSMLSSKEDDWRLSGTSHNPVTTRTRHGGKGRPNISTRKKQFNEPESSSDSEEDNEELIEIAGPPEADIEEDVDDESDASTKPPPTRAIFELDGLMESLEKHCRCPECHGPLKPSMKSNYLASRLILTCTNQECCYIHSSKQPTKAKIGAADLPSHDRSTDYAINVLFVLAFISMGDG
jgi:hypothetical protein